MKSQLQNVQAGLHLREAWTDMMPYYFTDNCDLIIENHRQLLPVHYHVKDFMTDAMITTMEKKLGL
jgi:hypothetical protein